MNEARSRLIREHSSRSFMFYARRSGPWLEVGAENLLVSSGYLLRVTPRGSTIVRGDRMVPTPKNIPWSTEYEHS